MLKRLDPAAAAIEDDYEPPGKEAGCIEAWLKKDPKNIQTLRDWLAANNTPVGITLVLKKDATGTWTIEAS